MTDMEDRLRLLQKNVDENSHSLSKAGSACVRELTWGDKIDKEIVDPLPDFGMNLASSIVLSFLLKALARYKLCSWPFSWFLTPRSLNWARVFLAVLSRSHGEFFAAILFYFLTNTCNVLH